MKKWRSILVLLYAIGDFILVCLANWAYLGFIIIAAAILIIAGLWGLLVDLLG